MNFWIGGLVLFLEPSHPNHQPQIIKIVQPTPDLLILQSRIELPVIKLFLVIFGLCFGGIPLLGLSNTTVATLTCDAKGGRSHRISPHLINCQLTSSNLLKLSHRNTTFKLQGAKSEENEDGDGYRTILLTDKGDIDWKSYSSSSHDRTPQIEQFIHNLNAKDLAITERNLWLVMFFFITPFMGIGFSLVMTPFVCRSCCIFDKKLKIIVFKHRDWMTDRVIVYSIHDVKDIQVKKKTNNDYVFYTNELVLSSGERQELAHSPLSGLSICKEAVQVSDCVRQFLNLKPS